MTMLHHQSKTLRFFLHSAEICRASGGEMTLCTDDYQVRLGQEQRQGPQS